MKSALLLIDIQNDYFEYGKNPLVGSNVAVNKANELLKFFRDKGKSVFHVQHVSTRPDATFFIPDTNGVEIHQQVKPLESEVVVLKHYPNSFRDTILLDELKKSGIEQLFICGMMSHICVDTTVRAAKDLGFECIVAADACATRSLEFKGQYVDASMVQASFMAALSYFFAKVISVDECCEMLA